MFESDQDAEDPDQMFLCPYDASHSVTASRMKRHLVKCRKNFLISENAICPFNDQHVICAPEMDYHKLVCPDKPERMDDAEGFNEITQFDGEHASPVDHRLGNSSPEETSHSVGREIAMNSTGCESGLDFVGGIGNCVSLVREIDETGFIGDRKATEAQGNERHQNGIREDCVNMEDELVPPMAELESPNGNIAIERQLEQSESDTASSGTNGSIGNDEGFSGEERFDYTKYIPSKDLREDFLKLIKQDKEVQVHDEKHQTISQPYGVEVWPQGYSLVGTQFQASVGFQPPTIQPAYISYSMIPPYTGPYGFSHQLPGPGNFVTGPDQGMTFECSMYPVTRQHQYRSYYRRRNNYNSFSPRLSNHNNYNSRIQQTHSESFLNNSNNPELNKTKEILSLQKTNGSQTHDDFPSARPTLHARNGCHNKNLPPSFSKSARTSHCDEIKQGDVHVQQLVDIGEVHNKSVNGNVDSECGEIFHEAENEMNGQLEDSEKSEYKKQIRKLRKKICEINSLEEKRHCGAKLDCDQLKKLSRKREFEEQLRSLTSCWNEGKMLTTCGFCDLMD